MEEKPEAPRGSRRGSLIGPLVLIGLGIVLLLSNLGVVDWDIWQIVFRLWPVLLIAAGIDLVVGRRSAIGTIIVLAVMLGLILGGVWLLSGTLGGERRTEEFRQTLDGAERADIEIHGSVGRLTVGPLEEPGVLVRGTIDLAPRERIEREFTVEDGTARFTLQSHGEWPFPSTSGWNTDRIWEVRLALNLPLRLTVESGVGQTLLELSALTVTELRVNTGVGQTRITLPGNGRYSANVDTGVGETEIVLPEGLAARIVVSAGIGDVQVPDDFSQEGDVYLSPGYEQAEDRVELTVSGGIGSIVIKGGGQ